MKSSDPNQITLDSYNSYVERCQAQDIKPKSFEAWMQDKTEDAQENNFTRYWEG